MKPTKAATLTRYARIFLPPFLVALAFLSVESVCDLMQPTLMASIVDRGIASRDLSLVITLGATMLLVAAIGAVGAVGRNIIASRVSWDFAARLRSDLFARTLSMDFRSLEGFDAASLVTRCTNDVTQVQALVNGMMRIFAKAPIIAIGSVVMALRLEPRLAPVFLVVVPLAALVIALNLSIGFGRFRRVQTALDAVTARLREFLSGIRLVKAYGREDRETALFSEANAELVKASSSALRVMALIGPLGAVIVNFGIVAVLWLGGIEVSSGHIQVGKIIAFVTYLSQLLFALGMIQGIFTFFVRARVSWARIREVLEASDGLGEGGVAGSGFAGAGCGGGLGIAAFTQAPELHFSQVTFAHAGSHGRPVLEDIDFACEAGKLTAIVGPTGAGKTSLVNLIPRFHEPMSGRILADGRDIAGLELRALRASIAVVPQRSLLFGATIGSNIAWGREGANEADIEAAARLAEAHEFIAGLPEGYRSVLGQGGINLSGGQRQRLALARAFLRRPAILVLDDATSAVDALTESIILATIRGMSPSATTIVVTQRVAAARMADRIVVLDEGRVAGIGSYAGLLASSELWRDIVRAQLGREALDA